MGMATVAQHQEISERFLSHAEEEFEKGDLLQASEKAWGAVAHYVKSVAKAAGWVGCRQSRRREQMRQGVDGAHRRP